MKYLLSLIKLLIWLVILGIVYRGEVADFFISLDYSKMDYIIYLEIIFFILFIFFFFFKKKKFSLMLFYFFLFLLGVVFFFFIISLRQFW